MRRIIILRVFIQMSKCLQPDRKCVLLSGVLLKPVIAANRRKQEQDGEIEY